MADRSEPREPTEEEKKALQRAIDAEARRRRAANKARQSPGSHRPSGSRSRRDIMNDLT